MARFSSIESWDSDTPPKNSLPCVVQGATVYVAFDTALDTISAKSILSQKKETLEKEALHLEKKLQNEAYKNAKPEQWQEDSDLLKFKHVESEKLTHFIGLLE
jgi:valyl-tRNA synthetase